MYLKNTIQRGDFLTLVPTGIPATLQYDISGVLEKVFYGYGEGATNISDKLLPILQCSHIVPRKIGIADGTSWVTGVFYTSTDYISEGVLPECLLEESIDLIVSDASRFNFFAGNITSLAATFKGAIPIRNWLHMAGFNLLPGQPVLHDMTYSEFIKFVNSEQFSFNPNMISHYIIYRNQADVLYIPTGQRQYICKSIKQTLNANGLILAEVTLSDSSVVTLQYCDIVKYNICEGKYIVFSRDNQVVRCFSPNAKLNNICPEDTLICSVCGKAVPISPADPCRCNDELCMSNQFNRVNQFLHILNLPTLDYPAYIELCKTLQLISFTDTLLLPQYKDQVIEVTLSKLLQAVIPDTVVSNPAIFTIIANRCNNSIRSLMYYINHPAKLHEFYLSGTDIEDLIKWLSVSSNANDLVTILESSQINISQTNKKFEGMPIFRGITIMITGEFKHGNYEEISAILQSYEATVVFKYNNNVSCVIIGDILQNIDGKAVKAAKSAHKLIVQEFEFFQKYGIDADIQKNLE